MAKWRRILSRSLPLLMLYWCTYSTKIYEHYYVWVSTIHCAHFLRKIFKNSRIKLKSKIIAKQSVYCKLKSVNSIWYMLTVAKKLNNESSLCSKRIKCKQSKQKNPLIRSTEPMSNNDEKIFCAMQPATVVNVNRDFLLFIQTLFMLYLYHLWVQCCVLLWQGEIYWHLW